MNTFSIERNGTGIERTGTGIERTGTGIERTGTGIERTGTGIERTGTGIAVRSARLACALLALGVFGAVSAAESDVLEIPLVDDLAAELVVRGDAVALQFGEASCALSGAGWSVDGYVTLPIQYTFDADGQRAIGEWSANGGSKVQGDGSGDKTPSSRACEKVFDRFFPSEGWATSSYRTHVWGEAEITIDGKGEASAIFYRWDAKAGGQPVALMSLAVRVQ